MKKLFLLTALVGAVLTGCMNEEVYEPKSDTPISFEVANYVVQPRAAGAFDTNETFGVDAWSTDATVGTVKMMDSEVVSYVSTSKKWTTATPYYWPINGTVDFIAYYPTSVKPTIVYDYAGADKLSYGSATEPCTVTDIDLMYADKAIRYSANVEAFGFTGVPTYFRHALAKVNFQVQNAYPAETNNSAITYEIVVNSITLNTYQTGSVTLTNSSTTASSPGTWSVTGNVWTPTSDLTALTWKEDTDVPLVDNTARVYNERVQYVLPQTLTEKVTVAVVYTVTQKQNGTTISVKKYEPAAIKLNTMGLTSWEMNKNITYTISITAKSNQILFAPAVEDWGTASGATTIK